MQTLNEIANSLVTGGNGAARRGEYTSDMELK
jgi:hypothetical protein